MGSMQKFFLGVILVLMASCSGPYMGKDQYGADEFVMDSYKIREGKFSDLIVTGKQIGRAHV